MSLKRILFLFIIFQSKLQSTKSDVELKELFYRGLSLTWRRLNTSQSNSILFEFRIEMSVTDQTMSLCHLPNDKGERLSSNFGLQCIDSWDQCLSWPSHRLKIFCYSRQHDLFKILIRDRIHLSLNRSSGLKNLFYEIEYPRSNYSCCWMNLSPTQEKVRLTSYLNLNDFDEKINTPPIIRFPEEISLNRHIDYSYSFHVFDPDGDLFDCQLKSLSVDFLLVEKNCSLKFDRSKPLLNHQYLLRIDLIEYFGFDTSQIRSRLPFQILVWIEDNQIDASLIDCRKSTFIDFVNIKTNFIDVSINQTTNINLIYRSQCEISADQCLMNSLFDWKRIKIHQKLSSENHNEIEFEFEWIPKTIDHCSFHLHCVRCSNQFYYFIEKCFYTFVYGSFCHRIHIDRYGCSWSSFTIWKKINRTLYQRERFCRQINNENQNCSSCFGSSIEYQSSLAFRKDFELLEESFLSPSRAQSTMKILLISTSVWIGTFLLALLFSIYFQWKRKSTTI